MSTTEVLLPEVEYVREHIRTDAPLETLGQRLRRLAEARDLTQWDLANALGVHQRRVHEWYFDTWAEHVRFRMRNAESNETFYLRQFYPYYLNREEVAVYRS